MKKITDKQLLEFINLFKLYVELDDVMREWLKLTIKKTGNYS